MNDPTTAQTWGLAGLVEAAGELLGRAEAAPADQRIAARPDARTVRYYQSIGVVDRPLAYEGRQARYGRRHLLQVVCVKLLQVRGHSLAQIQTALAGRTDRWLEQAVAEAVGTPPVSPSPTPTRAGPRALVAASLAPGVTVTIDPSQVSDPQAILAALARALTEGGSP